MKRETMKLFSLIVGSFLVGFGLMWLSSNYHYQAGFADASKNATCSLPSEMQGCVAQLGECNEAYESWKLRADQLQTLLGEVMVQCPSYKEQE